MKTSRHLESIFATVARDFICADAEGLGVGVVVTYGELVTAKARLFRRPLLRRYHLSDVESTRVRRGESISYLLIEVGGHRPTTVMILYTTAAADDFERLVATLERLSRRRRYSGHTRRQASRRHLSSVRRNKDHQPRTSAMP